eukprot:CAMPEP_0119298854 /NCGR_PEP_ID=MMETSP1333-20130426/974_1 /TAXON_ID=418940 /ORGANISM="Scyphosphaera apsteinii, Strain RCC1455" /LENGTH=436 /DNA_ID=CAMNT_0007300067 /DNA_START=43 /DNA_END=1350 /DNA_ORIENTATION=+
MQNKGVLPFAGLASFSLLLLEGTALPAHNNEEALKKLAQHQKYIKGNQNRRMSERSAMMAGIVRNWCSWEAHLLDGSTGVCVLREQCESESASATADVHLMGLGGGKMDVKGRNHKVYCFLSTTRLTVNARIKYASFMLPPSDFRSVTIKRVHGSFISDIFISLHSPAGKDIQLRYSASHPYTADLQVWKGTEVMQRHLEFPSYVSLENEIQVSLAKASPVTLNFADGEWKIKVYPGSYQLEDGSKGTHVNVQLTPVRPTSDVSPHGLIGQSYNDIGRVEGKLDQYTADANGEYTTSAQGEGGIEGNIEDYEIEGDDPYASSFRFSRFGMKEAAPRNVADLTGNKLPRSAVLPQNGAALGDGPESQLDTIHLSPPIRQLQYGDKRLDQQAANRAVIVSGWCDWEMQLLDGRDGVCTPRVKCDSVDPPMVTDLKDWY